MLYQVIRLLNLNKEGNVNISIEKLTKLYTKINTEETEVKRNYNWNASRKNHIKAYLKSSSPVIS